MTTTPSRDVNELMELSKRNGNHAVKEMNDRNKLAVNQAGTHSLKSVEYDDDE
jgi:hypothetical protein